MTPSILQMGGAWECGECGHLATEEEVVAREEQLAAAVRTIADTDKYGVTTLNIIYIIYTLITITGTTWRCGWSCWTSR